MKSIYMQFFNNKLFTKNRKLNKLIENLFELIDEDDFMRVYQSQIDELSNLSVEETVQRFVLTATRKFSSIKSINENVLIKFLLTHNYQNTENENPQKNAIFDFIFNNQKIRIITNEQFTLEVYNKNSDTKFEDEAETRIVASFLDKVEILLHSNNNLGTLKNIMEEFDIEEQAQCTA